MSIKIMDLPQEMLCHILSFSEISDIENFRKTCTAINTFVIKCFYVTPEFKIMKLNYEVTVLQCRVGIAQEPLLDALRLVGLPPLSLALIAEDPDSLLELAQDTYPDVSDIQQKQLAMRTCLDKFKEVKQTLVSLEAAQAVTRR